MTSKESGLDLADTYFYQNSYYLKGRKDMDIRTSVTVADLQKSGFYPCEGNKLANIVFGIQNGMWKHFRLVPDMDNTQTRSEQGAYGGVPCLQP